MMVRGNDAHSDILANIFKIFYKAEQKWSKEKIANNIRNNKKEYYLLFKGQLFVGAMELKFFNKSSELEALATKIQNKGHGTELLKYAESLAKKRKCEKIWCYSLARYNAGRFYKNNDWKEIRFIENLFDNQACYVYEKSL